MYLILHKSDVSFEQRASIKRQNGNYEFNNLKNEFPHFIT